jgi:HD-GYP domain-containing protein (c-di-GMP phosphodiesterase class II)
MSGNQITIEARIVSIADAVEAMSSDRPYRKARTNSEIIEELQRCAKTQFDPQVVEAAIDILKGMELQKKTKATVSTPEFQTVTQSPDP